MPRWILVSFLLLHVAATVGAQATSETLSGLAEGSEPPVSSWQLEAAIGLLSGDTSYELKALSPDPRSPEDLVEIRSELEFPLDVTLLGATARWSPGQPASRRWTFTAGLRTNLDDPSDRMTDGDWIAGRQISHTESPAQLDLWYGGLEVAYALRKGPHPQLSLLLRVDYQRIEQHLVGYEGWRRSLFSDEVFAVTGTVPVLDYRVTYLSPQLGGRLARDLGDHVRAKLEATGGVSLAWDEDDHLLRGRLSEGDGTGFGAHGGLAVDLLPGFVSWRWLTVSVAGGLWYHHVEGDVKQTWYRDEDLPAGTVIEGIPYMLESLQAEASLRVGAVF